MKSPLRLSMCNIISFLLFLSSFPRVSFTYATSFLTHPLCQNHEGFALLQFKQSFIISSSASRSPFAYPKIESWKLHGRHGDCCTWDGVECDNSTGHVIGLDLSSSCLHGFINSSSSLFHLAHLRKLNLADNHFNQSEIPPSFSHLSKLIYLNLSYSVFSGPIPSEFSKLSKLVSLDLSLHRSSAGQLVLKMLEFQMLLQNLTSLEFLHLDGVRIPSTVPSSLANLSSLTSLRLQGCRLFGEFPPAVFQLPNLEYLYVTESWDLSGYLPEFNSTSPLRELILAGTGFKGKLPASLGNLRSLQFFETHSSNFSGKIPASFENLTELVHLGLDGNPFEVPNVSSLSWLGRQSKLTALGLTNVILNSEIPPYIANLTQLQELYLAKCQIFGQIPSWLSRMTQLSHLNLGMNELQGVIPYSISQLSQLKTLVLAYNMLQGPFPVSIFQLSSLQLLHLAYNNLSGIMEFDAFLKLQNLTGLLLSGNMLSLHAKYLPNATRQKFVALGLGWCNLGRFPSFLRDQDRLEWLDLSGNNIHGMIPSWVWNISQGSLQVLDFSRNFLTGFEHRPTVLRWAQLVILDLGFNMLQGSIPIPPQTAGAYFASGNNFTGKISSVFCNLLNLRYLDVSNNNLGGMLPQCLETLSGSLELLILGGNNFHGKIPPTHPNACNLKVLMLGGNQFEGQVPRSLGSCTKLEILDLGNNQINDVFPSWLSVLQQLKILILRSNQFNGMLSDTESESNFPMLGIIDLSQNNFSGQLPTQLFLNWNAMKITNASQLAYMHTFMELAMGGPGSVQQNFWYQISLNNKGMKQQYYKILEFFVFMDLSGNGFIGEIPTSIGNLRGLYLLNLSNNALNGSIPTFLGNLTQLESLDLSRNKLTGEIPHQLTQLNFLAAFNVSENNLTGPIPQGKQFDTFPNSSYQGNLRLCGNPLSRKCKNSEALPPSNSKLEENEATRLLEFGWRPVVMGYASGLLVGLMIGHIVVTQRQDWFMKTFRVSPQRRTRTKKLVA